MKKAYWTIFILVAVAIGVSFWYYAKQPVDVVAVAAHHVVATTSPPSIASSTAADLSGWKTYTNSQYGVSFQYPSTLQISTFENNGNEISTGQGDLNPGEIGFYDFGSFSWTLSDGAFEETLKYDKTSQQWQVGLGGNETQADAFCPIAKITSAQKVPYYQIGDFRTGRQWDFAYVTSKGIIVLSEQDSLLVNPITGVDPAGVQFSNPKDVFSVKCNFSDQSQVESSLSIPPLPQFAGFNWQQTSTASNTAENLLYYDNFDYQSNLKLRQENFVQLPGQLWTLTLSGLSDTTDAETKFRNYYDSWAKQAGWQWSDSLDAMQITFSAPSADGALGSVWGYLNVQNSQLNLLGLSYQITKYTDQSDDGPIQVSCPCSLKLQVFESDSADVNNFTFTN